MQRWRSLAWLALLTLFGAIVPEVTAAATTAKVVFENDCFKVTCPPDYTLYTCGDTANPRAYDIDVVNNCPTAPGPVIRCTPPPGSALPVGENKISCVVVINQDIVGTCSFVITVVADKEDPKIECPADIKVLGCDTAATGLCGAVVNYPAPIATDNSGFVSVSCNPPSGSFFSCGTHTVICQAFDRCQNAVRCVFKIVVVPGKDPTIECPRDIVILTCNNKAVAEYPEPQVDPAGTAVVCSIPPGTVLGVGSHPVLCVASNACGVARCTFTITVRQIPDPTIVCPDGPFTFTVPCDKDCIPIKYPLPLVQNGSLAFCRPAPGDCLPPGEHLVTCVATNACGRSVCEFKVIVVRAGGGEPAVIRCPQDIVVTTCELECTKVTYPKPAVANGDLVKCDPPSGSCFPIGETLVTCLATNGCGDAVRCQFKVIVRRPPDVQIRCPESLVVATCDDCAEVRFPDPIVLNGNLVSCDPPSGSCFKVGTNVVLCIATNGCSKDACRFLVIVKKKPLPIIHCPEDVVIRTCDPCLKLEFPRPVVENGAIAFCDPAPGTCLQPGIHVITCVATNECGRSACKFTVTVRPEASEPEIKCPRNVIVESCESNCQKVEYANPIVVNGTLVSCVPPSGSCFPLGTTIVHCIASNKCGRTDCKFTVTVRPKLPPVIRCPDDLVLETCGDCADLQFPRPVVLNGALFRCNPPIGTCLPMGKHIIECVATNECGRSVCRFTVTVRKQETIDIKCPRDLYVRTCGQGEVIDYPKPEITGTADPASYVLRCDPPPGSFFPVGTNKVICCAFDRCTQKRVCCEFNIIVGEGRACVKPPANMVLWLPLDEPAGGWSGSGILGNPGGPQFGAPVPLLGSKVLNSLCFDGQDDYVSVPNYAAIILNTNDLAIDAWVLRRDQGSRHVMVSKVGQNIPGVGPTGYEFFLDNGSMHLWLGGSGGAVDFNSATIVPVDNRWHHVAVTVNRSALGVVKFYLNGAPVSAQAGPIPNNIGNSSRLNVAALSFPAPGNFFDGCMDEIEIFDRALSDYEVFTLWQADRAGKCKIKCIAPWDLAYAPDGSPIVARVGVCNCSGVKQTITWVVNTSGPVPIVGPSSGSFDLESTYCDSFYVNLGRPAVDQPVGAVLEWEVTLYPTYGCPIVCKGAVINPGPIVVEVPDEVVPVPGSTDTADIPVGVDGLPPGQPLRIRAIGTDMQPDPDYISLNGLPPGTPWILNQPVVLAEGAWKFNIPVRFVRTNPGGFYTILMETDLNGDGEYDTLRSFDVSNPVVAPVVLSIHTVNGVNTIVWKDNVTGVLESSESVNGPWTPIAGAHSGYVLKTTEKRMFFRVTVPIPELATPAAQ